ncbi:unnamed protein product [Adineta steineri]|uniref:VWFA domain-containing protein n=1 Tax=Adineta steineri TaxID=433720 RepID=A0A813P7S4_9BILA|nr:unnamed protein product [Adineta steineri]CAF0746590.1 unnamed protein product [Adineta steineri]
MASLSDATLMDADLTCNMDVTQTSSSTEIAKEAMDKSGSNSDPPVQVASSRLRLNSTAENRLYAAMRKHEIATNEKINLCKLKGFEIVLICDDSGSMNTMMMNSQQTRWNSLRKFVRTVAEFGTILDSNGVDVCFLNRPDFYKIIDPRQIEPLFNEPPSGYTPLTKVLRKVLKMPAARRGFDKKLLIFICTDGEPTNDDGESDLQQFEYVMRSERQSETTHVMFLICTDEPFSVNYLKEWDRTMENVDITDTFENERSNAMQKYGNNFRFSRATYIMKLLLGAIDPKFDEIND